MTPEKFADHLALMYGLQLDTYRRQALVRELAEFAVAVPVVPAGPAESDESYEASEALLEAKQATPRRLKGKR